EESIRFVIHSNDVDDYGRNVLLYNFLHLTPYFSERLLHVVKTAIEDNGFKRKEPLLPEALKSLTSDEMIFWEKYTHDFRFRENFLEDAFNRVPDRTAWQNAFDILPKVQDILSYIILIHGKNDNVIPASESLALYKQLIAYNKPAYLCISPVLDHGDVQKNLTAYLDFFKILKAFSIFFRLAGNNQ
ncbi:MAG: hypothetical protein NZ522_07805, partial [Chitinophagales bacterium]|nr:hypothetical protein [Chitinophagales bacterium]